MTAVVFTYSTKGRETVTRLTKELSTQEFCEAKLPLRDTLEIPLYQGSSSSRRGRKEPQACKHRDHEQMCVYTHTNICVYTHVLFETMFHATQARFALAK